MQGLPNESIFDKVKGTHFLLNFIKNLSFV